MSAPEWPCGRHNRMYELTILRDDLLPTDNTASPARIVPHCPQIDNAMTDRNGIQAMAKHFILPFQTAARHEPADARDDLQKGSIAIATRHKIQYFQRRPAFIHPEVDPAALLLLPDSPWPPSPPRPSHLSHSSVYPVANYDAVRVHPR